MGRSRLQYRAQHKGTLSKNSRKKIYEAKLQKREVESANNKIDKEINYTSDLDNENTRDIENEDDFIEVVNEGEIDLMEQPKLYYLKNEFDTFVKDIKMEETLRDPLYQVQSFNILSY